MLYSNIRKIKVVNFNLFLLVSFISISFMTVNAYAATVFVNLIDADLGNADDLQAVVNNDQKPFDANGQAVFTNVDVGSYTLDIQNLQGQDVSFSILDTNVCDFNLPNEQASDTCNIDITGDNEIGSDFGSSGFGIGFDSGTKAVVTTSQGQAIIDEDESSDPPFRGCEVRVIKKDTNVGSADDYKHVPSSAEYIIKGGISGDELQSLIKDNGKTNVNIRIINDLHQLDTLPISPQVNSKYIGQFVFYKDEGLEQNSLNFRIDNINTDCTYITLVEPIRPLSNDGKNEFTPLGEKGKEKFEKHANVPPEYKLLKGESVVKEIILSEDPVLDARGINPPFGPCAPFVQNSGFVDKDNDNINDNEDPNEFDNAQFAVYNMVGNIHDKIRSKNYNGDVDLTIKLITDLNQLAIDKAKLVDNENPFTKIQLLLNPNTDSAQKLDFELKELSYNCKGVGFARSVGFIE